LDNSGWIGHLKYAGLPDRPPLLVSIIAENIKKKNTGEKERFL
jgi:hypothetical protein